MKVSTFNGCKVYNLSSGKTMPQWLSDTKKKTLAKDEEYRRRLELIQDFEMTTASQVIKMTKDHEHVIVTGTYPPIVRCYTVSDLAMKFQRGLTCDVIAFECLSDDFGKLVFLQSDRTLNFHAPYGTHYSLR
jgi:ribosome biogenesis protein ENP2